MSDWIVLDADEPLSESELAAAVEQMVAIRIADVAQQLDAENLTPSQRRHLLERATAVCRQQARVELQQKYLEFADADGEVQ